MQQKVDIAVVEVGLGGRLDCTNIITPLLCIITNISYDHTQFLGNTLAKIAGEKAGIIKPGVPVVIGESIAETRPVFESKAKEMLAPIVFAEDNPEVLQSHLCPAGGRDYTTRSFGQIHGELGGDYQDKNANTILTAVRLINYSKLLPAISLSALKSGFGQVCESTGLLGRWQKIHDKPLAVCDTGHNPGGWQYLSQQIKAQKAKEKRIVFGMVDDKDIDTVMGMLPKDAVYYWTQPTSKRAFPVEKVAQTAAAHQLKGLIIGDVDAAYRQALKDASPEDFVFVGGSSYVVADLLSKEL